MDGPPNWVDRNRNVLWGSDYSHLERTFRIQRRGWGEFIPTIVHAARPARYERPVTMLGPASTEGLQPALAQVALPEPFAQVDSLGARWQHRNKGDGR
jgi:hypothetical protein